MNGETESSTSAARNRLEKIKNKLDIFEKSVGLPPYNRDERTCEHLNLTSAVIRNFSADECGEVATDLASYAIYIQRTLNREQSYLKWLEAKIDLAVADELNDYSGYYSHEQRKYKAIVNNEYARELEEMRIQAQIKVSALAQLPFQINQLCRTLTEAQASKRRSGG